MSGPAAGATLPRRTIRSFVRREGRFTKGQQQAFERSWPVYGIDNTPDALDFPTLFGRTAPIVLEIGFGMGEGLAQMAAADPTRDYLGIEVHRPGIGSLLRKVEALGLSNLRVICDDAVAVLRTRIGDASLNRVQLYFPDPWPKKRHHKRRIIQPDFVGLLHQKLQPGGELHLATDWDDYARQMLSVMEASPGWRNIAASGRFAERPASRPPSKFEQRGLRLGHEVWDLRFARLEGMPVRP